MRIAKTFCTTREAATLLGVSVTTAQNWAESGLLDSWKTDGGHRRISRDSVARLLADTGAQLSIASVQTPKDSAPPKLNILVVEDDPMLLELYKIRLNGWSISPIVDVANDGFAGLVKVGLQRPDLLISDLQMPHLDGFEMIRSLYGMPDCREMRFVAITGLSESDIASAGGLPSGVTVLHKPIPFGKLEEIAQLVYAQKCEMNKSRVAA